MLHIVDDANNVIWLQCTSAISAMGMTEWMKKYYPNKVGKFASKDYFATLQSNGLKVQFF